MNRTTLNSRQLKALSKSPSPVIHSPNRFLGNSINKIINIAIPMRFSSSSLFMMLQSVDFCIK